MNIYRLTTNHDIDAETTIDVDLVHTFKAEDKLESFYCGAWVASELGEFVGLWVRCGVVWGGVKGRGGR